MLFNIILVLLVCIGIGLIIFACLSRKNSNSYSNVSYTGAEDSIRLVKQAVSDADNAIEQFNKLSSDVFAEFEEKYQELLFLYQMIDDLNQKFEKVDLNTDYNNNYDNNYLSNSTESTEEITEKLYSENPDFQKIREMYQKGFSISEISRVLGMGQGEVKLILDLRKGR